METTNTTTDRPTGAAGARWVGRLVSAKAGCATDGSLMLKAIVSAREHGSPILTARIDLNEIRKTQLRQKLAELLR